jgi:hypothetical protein
MRQQGLSWQEIATALNVPKTTIRRAFRQEAAAITPTTLTGVGPRSLSWRAADQRRS